MTWSVWLWIVGCGTGAVVSVLVIKWLATQQPAERVSDRWITDSLRDRRID